MARFPQYQPCNLHSEFPITLYTAEFHCQYSRLKGDSYESWLSNYVLDLDLNMPKHLSSILTFFFSKESSRGLHCYSIKGDCVLLLSVVFLAGKKKFFNVSLQIAPWQGFHNIIPNQYKEKQQMGLMRWKASHIHKRLTPIHKLNC